MLREFCRWCHKDRERRNTGRKYRQIDLWLKWFEKGSKSIHAIQQIPSRNARKRVGVKRQDTTHQTRSAVTSTTDCIRGHFHQSSQPTCTFIFYSKSLSNLIHKDFAGDILWEMWSKLSMGFHGIVQLILYSNQILNKLLLLEWGFKEAEKTQRG